MSLDGRPGVRDRFAPAIEAAGGPFRLLALASTATLSAASLVSLYWVIDVVGGAGTPRVFGLVVLASVSLAVGTARRLTPRQAAVIGGGLFAGGLVVYLATVPQAYLNLARQLQDTVALLTGLSVLRMTKAGVWALGLTPAPVFLTWYFALRRCYGRAALVGMGALGFFLLTGDAGTLHGLVGALAATGVLGFGDFDTRHSTNGVRSLSARVAGDRPRPGWQLSRRMAMMALVTTTVSFVPGGEARPLFPAGGATSVETSLVDTADRVEVLGSITLSPVVRFTATAEAPAYWRIGAFDRYTGSGWVRTGGDPRPYDDPLPVPEGRDHRLIRQTFTAETPVDVMPAAWKPVRVGIGAGNTLATETGQLRPDDPLDPGDQYTVESLQNVPSPAALREAGRDYPEWIAERYRQLPESTPDRVGAFTAGLAEGAENPYDVARRVEQWLSANKRYSLDVSRPSADVVASFLFEMAAGYCTYFATAMVVMLRTQGIPTRFVVGYTPGERVRRNQWVVRGTDSHAWVEAYFPRMGWVRFDPTPAAPRAAAERARLEQARATGETNVDTALSRSAGGVPAEDQLLTGLEYNNTLGIDERGSLAADEAGASEGGDGNASAGDAPAGESSGGLLSTETALYGLLVAGGTAAVAREAGVVDRLSHEVWLRRPPSGPPADRLHGTVERFEYWLGRRFRGRRPPETRREYLAWFVETPGGPSAETLTLYRRAIDLHERARFGGEVTAPEVASVTREFRELVGGN